MSLNGINHILNITLTKWLWDQELPADTDSDITSADSSSVNYNNSTYLESLENSPSIENTTPYLLAIIKETGKSSRYLAKDLKVSKPCGVIFIQDDEIDPTELVVEEANHTKKNLDNGGTLPLLNQSPSQSSPSVDAPNALDSPPPGVREDTSDAAFLARVGNLPGKVLTATDDNIFGVCQDWVHQNTRTHMDGRIEEDSNWK